MGKTNVFEDFIKHYNVGMKAMVENDYESSHKIIGLAVKSYKKYVESALPEHQEDLKRFGYELQKLQRILLRKSIGITEQRTKVESPDFLSEIAGLEEVKKELLHLIIYPTLYPKLYSKFKKSKGGGILMYGVPGTGKTWIARQVAKQIDAEFIEVKCSTVLRKYLGESEEKINEIFEEAKKHPCSIIFFDEFEALGGKRGKLDNHAVDRFVSELLTQLQGVEKLTNNIIVIAATNRPWDIDSAFLRPGRFNNVIHIPLPDANTRRDVIKHELNEIPVDSTVDIEEIVIQTEGFNKADVAEFCERLKSQVIFRLIKDETSAEMITSEDVQNVLATISSSVNKSDVQQINAYTEQRSKKKSSGCWMSDILLSTN